MSKINEKNKLSQLDLSNKMKPKMISAFEKLEDLERPQLLLKMAMDMLMTAVDDQTLATIYNTDKNGKILYDEINKNWYILNKFNIWKKDECGAMIIEDMSKSIVPIVNRAFLKLTDIRQDDDDTAKRFGKAINMVNTNSAKQNILKELRGKQPQVMIFQKMDNVNDYLFAFENGVYDLRSKRFRLPLPSELITVTCGYNYEPVSKEVQRGMNDINAIINSSMPDKDDTNVLLTQIAQCLDGLPMEEFYVWLGSGGNGKGVLRDFICRTFGPYFDTMEIEYLSKTKHGESAKGADEVMARKKNVRIVLTSEPESDMDVKIAKIKQLSGGDPVQTRFNYGSCFNFVPKFKLFFMTNYVITLRNAGPDIRRRFGCVRFPINFTSNPVLENDRMADPNLKSRIKADVYKIAFFHILLDKYNKWIANGKVLKLSKNIEEETAIFLNGYDSFTPFYTDVIQKTGDENDFIKLTDLHKGYKQYYTGETTSQMNPQEFRKGIESKGLMVKIKNGYNVVRGIKLNQEKIDDRIKNKEKEDVIEI